MLLGRQIEGIWHTGVEVYGTEYFYGGGICSMAPAEMERVFQLSPTRVVFMGFTHIEKAVCDDYLKGISARFTEATYDLLEWNCNHFTEELMQFLLNKSIPDDIRNQVQQVAETPMGRFLLPLLQQQQRAAQQAASAAGQRTLWTRGEEEGSHGTFPGCLSSPPRPSSSSSAPRAPVATADDQWPSTTGTTADTSQSSLGAVLRRVCVNEELVYSTKRIFLMTLLTLVNNLLLPQRDVKYMRVKYGNPIIQNKVLRIPGGEEALQLLGFERVAHFDTTVCNDVKNPALSASDIHTSAAQKSQTEAASSTTTSGEQEDGGFEFKQFETCDSEQKVVDQLKAHKQEIEAFLAALDRNKQNRALATTRTNT